MTHGQFISKIKTEFIKDNNYLLITRQQSTTSVPYRSDWPIFCEIITEDRDERDIIRISGPNSANVSNHVKIEVLSIIFQSPDHPNLGSYQQKFKLLYHGSLADTKDLDEIDFPFLLTLLERRRSLCRE